MSLPFIRIVMTLLPIVPRQFGFEPVLWVFLKLITNRKNIVTNKAGEKINTLKYTYDMYKSSTFAVFHRIFTCKKNIVLNKAGEKRTTLK